MAGTGVVGMAEARTTSTIETSTVGTAKTGVAGAVGGVAVGITVFAATSSSSKVSVIRRIDIQNKWRLHQEVMQIHIKGRRKKKAMIRVKRKLNKYKRYVPITSASCLSPSSLPESEILFFIVGSSSESSKTSSDPSEDKSTSGPHVAELRMEEGVTTKEELSFTA